MSVSTTVQYLDRSLLLLAISASDLLMRTIKFCAVVLRRNVENSCHKQYSLGTLRCIVRLPRSTNPAAECYNLYSTVEMLTTPNGPARKIAIFASVGVLLEYYHNVWYNKTRMVGLPDGENCLRIGLCLLVSTEYTNVTDIQTDRQTEGQTPHDVM